MSWTHEQREYEQAPGTLYRTQKSDMLNMTFQNVVFFRRNLYYQGKKILSVCTHFLSGDSLLRSEHADVLKSSVFIKLRKKLRISGHKNDSDSQKSGTSKKILCFWMTTTQGMVHSSFHNLSDFSSDRILQMWTHSKKSQPSFRNSQFFPYEFVSFFGTKKFNEKRDANLMVGSFR